MQFIKFIKSITKRIIALFTIIVILFVQVAGVLASEVPSTPSVPVAPSSPVAPNAPTPPTAPTPPVVPTAPTIPSGSLNNLPDSQNSGSSQGDQSSSHSKPKNSESSNEKTKRDRSINSDSATSDNSSSPAENQQSSSVSPKSSVVDNSTGGQNSDGNSGKTDLKTGNATNSVTGAVVANSNLSAVPTGLAGGGSAVVNEGNGSGSANNGAFVSEHNSNTIQDNKAVVINSVSQDTKTGGNSASKNVGDVNIKTGNANTTGTIITSVNTNVDGVVVAEFNVEDDHIGDIVLDFGNACIVNCSTLGGGNVANHQNGANSSNNALLDYALNTNKFQTNDAVVLNTLKLDSNTGKNYADKNTGGDVTITTGDANVSANALTFVNNNIAGNVIYGVVNIFGNLVGDIIAPFGFGLPCCLLSGNVQNTGNGAHSTNTADASVSSNDQLYQFNNANINNNLFFDANTGENEVSKNTDGNNTVNSGNANVTAQVINVANTNIVGGDWWLVLINQAGNWVGRILGSPEGTNLAGSNGIEFFVDENGEIYASNNGNGANSFNNAFSSSSANN
ncbi:MAG: hypothetical protein NZM26_01725, partial [Patescibacteria group bacterium]|nr:hypothetical protein [Patescibacteria group bacterium]